MRYDFPGLILSRASSQVCGVALAVEPVSRYGTPAGSFLWLLSQSPPVEALPAEAFIFAAFSECSAQLWLHVVRRLGVVLCGCPI